MASHLLSRWPVQSGLGIAVVVLLSAGFGTWAPSAHQPDGQSASAAPGAASAGLCPEGFYGSPEKGCTDVNECASANGGCHKLAACKNTPGGRTCGECPPDFAGTGYVGCFDVNECPNGDCSDRIPTDAETASPPVVKTPDNITVAAASEAGAAATFTVTATDEKDGKRQAYCLPRSGSTFPIGTTVVSCWASNTRGKLGRGAFTVTVTK